MIYILVGNNTEDKNKFISKISTGKESVFLPSIDASKDILLNYADNLSLFGNYPVIILNNIIKEGNISLNSKEIENLNNSQTTFIFIEDKLLAEDERKYKRFANIEELKEKKELSQKPKVNVFDIVSLFEKKDKIGSWILFRRAIDSGIEPEAISGAFFWKVKNMILSNSKSFDAKKLQYMSSNLVSMYHKAHMGEGDLAILLERFLLNQ